jgi:Immunoglobulin-like domain of bacterial spore germination
VLAAASDSATISAPAVAATVPRGPITVEGEARGFEAAVGVSVSLAGDAETLDAVSTLAGSAESPEPYHVTLDLSKAKSGDVVMLLVRGGTGLETDPGDFGAIPVMVG